MPGRRTILHQALVLALCLACPAAARAASDAAKLSESGCRAIAAAVDAAAPAGPVFIASYPDDGGIAALHHTAFVYDNAAAVIALLACGEPGRAARIGAALRVAAAHDRFWHDGRLRNAYRSGPVAPGQPPALPGWWDAAARRWNEDAYQAGTATGNVAWAALALLALAEYGHDPADTQAAASLMRWVAQAAWVAQPWAGYAGGYFGEEPAPRRLAWQSTEHNVDAAAAFARLARLTHDPAMVAAAARARGFVAAMWDPAQGRFWLGTGADGRDLNRSGSGIDAQLWPLIGIADAPADWRRVGDWVRAHYATSGGYGFRDGPDGIWTEGTAQAALVLHEPRLFTLLLAQRAPGGMLYASPQSRIRTGLALTPDSTTDDFAYFHLPHLGATAWAVLAATGTNPFAGR